LAADPENVEAQLKIAAIHLRLSEPDRAAPLLRSVCQSSRATSEQLSQARWSLGIACGQQRRWDEAADAIAAALEHRTNVTADEWYRLAYAQYSAGETETAARDVGRALKLQPDHPDALTLASILNVEPQPPVAPASHVSQTAARPSGW
jgi:tetratricopeptide (TPR) repeat protein